MRKLAVFVEGNTELVFLEALLIEFGGFHQVSIQKQRLHGGNIVVLHSSGVLPENAKFHIQIVDCQCDGKVLPAILARMKRLHETGYAMVLGIHDVYPTTKRHDIGKLRQGIDGRLNNTSVPAHVVLAVMEVEAWFVGEWRHFQKVDCSLTPLAIAAKHGIDLRTQSAELIDRPASFLSAIYRSVGATYKKRSKDAHRVVSRIDFDHLYAETRLIHASLDDLFNQLENFFGLAST